MEKLSEVFLKTLPEFSGHEAVYKVTDEASGLNAFVAIHTTKLGPAVGGTRMFAYASEKEAIRDALRLSRSMTSKCVMAGTQCGGGKAVIVGDPEKKTPELLHAYAKAIDKLQCKFYTGEDVGITEDDVQKMLTVSSCFIGRSDKAGDPSPFAALSTFQAIQTACQYFLGKSGLAGSSVAVKGVGKVGGALAASLISAGADVVIADKNEQALDAMKKAFPSITIITPEKIHEAEVDVYSPCALGNEFTEENKHEIRAKILCGAANNQLASPSIGDWFFENGIAYIPDYIVNAGGLINVVDEIDQSGYSSERVSERIAGLQHTLIKIFDESAERHIAPFRISEEVVSRALSRS